MYDAKDVLETPTEELIFYRGSFVCGSIASMQLYYVCTLIFLLTIVLLLLYSSVYSTAFGN